MIWFSYPIFAKLLKFNEYFITWFDRLWCVQSVISVCQFQRRPWRRFISGKVIMMSCNVRCDWLNLLALWNWIAERGQMIILCLIWLGIHKRIFGWSGGNESMVVKRRQLEKQHRATWLLLFTQIKFTGCWLAHFQQIKFWGTWSDVSCCKESGFDESQHNEPVDDRSWILVAVTVQSVALLCLMSSSIFLQWKWNCMQRHLANATCGDLVMNLTRANYGPQWSGIITNRNLTNLAATDKPQ